VGKIVPKSKDTASILYKIYLGMTVAEVIFFLCGGMSLFDSIVHSFGTAGTGGFGIKADSIASYSPYCQWVITIFMLLFGINFNLYFLLLIRRARAVLQSTELWTYLGILVVSISLITANIRDLYTTFAETLRHASFQVATIISTTGYATTDFNLWPGFSKGILLFLMFTGACAGSTAGGFKLSRIVIMAKNVGRQLRQLVHPRSVTAVKFEGKTLDDQTATGVGVYLSVYLFSFIAVFLLLCLEDMSFTTHFSATLACINNIGPGFDMVGPAANYDCYSYFSKFILSMAMLLGRLEIYPLLIALYPATWRKRS
jgi:trk system potassium uptake protein TrkH